MHLHLEDATLSRSETGQRKTLLKKKTHAGINPAFRQIGDRKLLMRILETREAHLLEKTLLFRVNEESGATKKAHLGVAEIVIQFGTVRRMTRPGEVSPLLLKKTLLGVTREAARHGVVITKVGAKKAIEYGGDKIQKEAGGTTIQRTQFGTAQEIQGHRGANIEENLRGALAEMKAGKSKAQQTGIGRLIFRTLNSKMKCTMLCLLKVLCSKKKNN